MNIKKSSDGEYIERVNQVWRWVKEEQREKTWRQIKEIKELIKEIEYDIGKEYVGMNEFKYLEKLIGEEFLTNH